MSQYATQADLAKWGLRASVLAGISPADQDAHLQAASAMADSYLGHRGYALPLTTWGDDLRQSVCKVAAWTLLNHRGASPDNPADAGVAKAHDDALSWWRDIARGVANLNVTSTASARAPVQRAMVISDDFENGEKTRGW